MRTDRSFKDVSMCVRVRAWHYQRHSMKGTFMTKGFSQTQNMWVDRMQGIAMTPISESTSLIPFVLILMPFHTYAI